MTEEIGKAVRLRKEGRLKESNELLMILAKKHPDIPEIQYQATRSFDVLGDSEAMELLLAGLADTTSDPDIRSYEKAIRFYAGKLDRTWI